MKEMSQRSLFVTSAIIFLAGGVMLLMYLKMFDEVQLMQHLMIISPLFLEFGFFLLIVAVLFNMANLKKVFSGIPRRIWILLGATVVAGTLITAFVAPREPKILYDEQIYESIAQNIAELKSSSDFYNMDASESFGGLWKRIVGRAAMCNNGRINFGEYHCYALEYNKQPNGWPYVLSLVFRLAGVKEIASSITNNLIYALSVLTVFLIGFLLFKNARTGLWAALVFALTPQVLIWGNTAAVEPSAVLFCALAFLSVLIFAQAKDMKSLFLMCVALAFGIQFRPESFMIFAPAALFMFFFRPGDLKRAHFYLGLTLLFMLIIPHIVHLWAVRHFDWGSEGTKFSGGFLLGNLKVNTLYYFNNIRFPVVFTVLAVLGNVCC